MTLSERGSRHKRIWVETRTHLGRDTNASGTRHTCACSHVRQQVVSNRTGAVWGNETIQTVWIQNSFHMPQAIV